MLREEALTLAVEMGGTPRQIDRMRSILTEMQSAPTRSSAPTRPARSPTWLPEAWSSEERAVIGGLVGRRYEDLGVLGQGGMGEVRRIRDRDLGRPLAMKIATPAVMARPGALARFIEEAQATAQLQHPGIIPVHELGQLPDGRVYFTMKEVRGRTLADVICEVHSASSAARWEPARSTDGSPGWTFRRLVDAFHRVCEAVSYAHERGVIHRDLKPENVMVGEHGEVMVLDWGIAKVTGRPDLAAEQGALTPGVGAIVTERSRDNSKATRMGSVAGTPAYMPPEQARGEIDRIDARSDIYALGAILYELLSGRPPYLGSSAGQVLQMVRAGPPQRVGRQISPADTFGFEEPVAAPPKGPLLPPELLDACERAMARAPGERFQTAAGLARVVRDWLDGAKRREQARAVVDAARARRPEADDLRRRAEQMRAAACELLEGVPPWEGEERKAPGWAQQDAAVVLDRRASLLDMEMERGLHAALRVDPGLAEAHAALSERLMQEHQAAEAARNEDIRARAEVGLREHAGALAEGDEIRARCAAYLQGDGALTLVTAPPGAEVLLHRYILHNRRMVPRFERSLGETPLEAVSLPMGSYLCELRHPQRPPVRYPICIGRQEHWDGVRPGDHAPTAVQLPVLSRDDVYIPPGWFWSGGDDEGTDSLPRRRLWIDALVMRRFPITNAEYLAFLNDLLARGRQEEALRRAPRERAGTAGELGALIYGRERDGRFALRPDAEGDTWHADLPVLMVDWWGVAAWCRWHAERTGRPWRLPGELEWEKAARGTDGRFFPWGDHIDPSWCCYRDSHRGRALPAVVDSFPTDVSVYGVRGLGGNVREWCADAWSKAGPATNDAVVSAEFAGENDGDSGEISSARWSIRGGAWSLVPRNARASVRGGSGRWNRVADLSGRAVFRLAD